MNKTDLLELVTASWEY